MKQSQKIMFSTQQRLCIGRGERELLDILYGYDATGSAISPAHPGSLLSSSNLRYCVGTGDTIEEAKEDGMIAKNE